MGKQEIISYFGRLIARTPQAGLSDCQTLKSSGGQCHANADRHATATQIAGSGPKDYVQVANCGGGKVAATVRPPTTGVRIQQTADCGLACWSRSAHTHAHELSRPSRPPVILLYRAHRRWPDLVGRGAIVLDHDCLDLAMTTAGFAASESPWPGFPCRGFRRCY